MLQANQPPQPASSTSDQVTLVPQLTALGLLRIFHRRWPVIAKAVAVTLAIALVYMLIATKKYTGTTLLYIDPHKQSLISKQEVTVSTQPDPAVVDTQVEILKSDSVLLAAVRSLDLTKDLEFNVPPGLIKSAIHRVVDLLSFRDKTSPTQQEIDYAAAKKISDNLKVKQVAASYVVEIDYTNEFPALAARIANGVAQAYSTAALDARYEAAQTATKWLELRITGLQEQAASADRAVQKFKAENNLVDTSRGLLNEQQLGDVNAQLVVAKAATAEAKARWERVKRAAEDAVMDGSVADALKSEVITRLRAQYLDLATRYGEISREYGAKHGAAVNLRRQMEEVRNSIALELRRISESVRGEYQVALEREESLRQSLKSLVQQADVNNQAIVKLRDLEATAQTYRTFYDNFFQKFQEATQQASFPDADARVVTAAMPPEQASWPKAIIILPASVVLGLLIGASIALLREFLGNNFRSYDDVQNYAGVECLGILPDLSYGLKEARRPSSEPGLLGGKSSFARHAVQAPFSRFTETLRNVKVSIDIARAQQKSGVIGIVSSVPKEGKSTFAANLALLTAQMGHKTLLIDGDLHNPSITRTLTPGVEVGLIELLSKSVSLADVVKRDFPTGLEFLPTVIEPRKSNVVSLLTSQAMQEVLDAARQKYEYVIVDLPPVVPVVDVKAAAHMVDNFVLVIEWGVTSRDVVREALENADTLRSRLLGAVLNKADPAELSRFEAYKGDNFGSYYVES